MYLYALFIFSHINLPVQQVSASHNLPFLDMIFPVDVKPHILWFLRLLVWRNVCRLIDLWQLLPLICLWHTYAENTYTEDTNILRYCKNTEVNNWANLRDLIAATGLVILLKLDANRQFSSLCDLEIWWMTSKNNRAPLLYYIKLCASFQVHQWMQTEVTVQKRSLRVKISGFFLSCAT